jgi:hypothetical protein
MIFSAPSPPSAKRERMNFASPPSQTDHQVQVVVNLIS